MARKYPYYPAFDGKKAQPGTEKLVELCGRRWKTKNMGIYANRLMRNSQTAGKKASDPGMDKFLSVHATGAACDVGYAKRATGVDMWDWFLKYAKELGIVEIHDYAFDANASDKKPGWGRGFRCSRGEGEKGVKIYNDKDNAGSQGGMWIHIELDQEMAKDAVKFEAAWRALPKPGAA
jgi:sugar phosphate isomerase/epimerase